MNVTTLNVCIDSDRGFSLSFTAFTATSRLGLFSQFCIFTSICCAQGCSTVYTILHFRFVTVVDVSFVAFCLLPASGQYVDDGIDSRIGTDLACLLMCSSSEACVVQSGDPRKWQMRESVEEEG
jgi:hypothetical protein